MEMLTNGIDQGDLEPGDHIYSWRAAFAYAHHGIYVGDQMVIHFTCGGQEIGTGTILDQFIPRLTRTTSKVPCRKCGDQSMRTGVLLSCLSCFLSRGSLYRFRYSVSKAVFLAQARGGTCTLAASDPPEVVIHRARYLLQHGFGTYNVFKNNCEDFAVYCKTGLLVKSNCDVALGGSGQLAALLAAGSVIASASAQSFGRTFGGLVLGVANKYCATRYNSDISVREDAVKISVENLVQLTDQPEASSTAIAPNS